MRKFFTVVTLLLLSAFAVNAQQGNPPITVCTDLNNWAVTNAQGANVNPVEVLPGCLDPALVACLCAGAGQQNPNICTPAGAMEIWGEPWGCIQRPNGCNIPCSYPAASYTFTRRIPIDDCSIIDSIHFDVQGDNRLVLNFNGFDIVNTANADWALCFDETDTTGRLNIANYNAFLASLTPGQDLVITATVTNINGAPCINYAYFSFCADIFTSNVEIDASFLPFTSPGNPITIYPGNYELYDNLGAQHSWYILSSKTSCPQSINDFTPIVAYAGETFNYTTAQTGVYYWVLHRVRTICGEACYLESICTGCPENKVKTECHWNGPIDCSFVDNWEWIWDSVKGSGGEARSNNSTIEHHKVLISPNPAQELLNISWDARTPMKNLQLFSVEGKLVKSNTLQEGAALHTLKVSDLAPGTYFLRMTDKDGNVENHKVEITQ